MSRINGITDQEYDILRMAMFGQESLAAFKSHLKNKQSFIDWAINEAEVMYDLDNDDEDEVRQMLSDVFDHEVAEYREVA